MKEGWGGLNEDLNSKTQLLAPSDDEFIIAKLFSTEEGIRGLAALQHMTIDKPSFQSMHSDGINTSIAMAIREGENNLYRKILLTLKKVNNYGKRRF